MKHVDIFPTRKIASRQNRFKETREDSFNIYVCVLSILKSINPVAEQWGEGAAAPDCTFTGAAISSCRCISTTPIGALIYIFGPGRQYPLLRH